MSVLGRSTFFAVLLICVNASASDDIYDRLYDDDTSGTRNFIGGRGAVQIHNFWHAGDEDWIAFNVDPNRAYSVDAEDVATSVDIDIYLYHSSNLTTPVVSRADQEPGANVLLSWNSGSASGTILARIVQNPTAPVWGEGTSYTLTATLDEGAGTGLPTISGTVRRAGIGLDGGALDDLPTTGSMGGNTVNYHYTRHQVVFPPGSLAHGTYEMLMQAPRDLGYEPWARSTLAWRDAHGYSMNFRGVDRIGWNTSIIEVLTTNPLGNWETSVELSGPVRLTLEFLTTPTIITLSQNFLTIDIPSTATTSRMRVHAWTGTEWIVLPGHQEVGTNTVTALIRNFYTGIFAAAPVASPPAATRRGIWKLYR